MQQRSWMGSVLVLGLPWFWQGPAQVSLQDGRDIKARRQSAAELELVENIEDKTPFRVAAMIRDLPAAYGAFADLDGDGDLDYLATEMIHGKEMLTSFLKTRRGWRRADRESRPFNGKHPTGVFVVEDDGSGKPLVILDVGWPPYLYAIPTDGRGRFVTSKILALAKFLPRRVSKPFGVDNNPYRIDRVVPAQGDGPARLEGRCVDSEGGRSVDVTWSMDLRKGRVVAHGQRPIDREEWDGWYKTKTRLPPMQIPALDGKLERQGASPLRRAEMMRLFHDVDGDGVTDLVSMTADYTAHFFHGIRKGDRGRLAFDKERSVPLAVPLRRVKNEWAVDERETAASPIFWADQIELRTSFPERGPIRLVLWSTFSSGLVFYRFDPKRLRFEPEWIARNPLPRADTVEPDAGRQGQMPRGKRFTSWKSRWDLLEDFDGDGTPDSLSTVSARRWRGSSKDAGQVPVHGYVVWWSGASRAEYPELLLRFPEPQPKVEHWTDGDPLSLRRIPVFEKGKRRERYCIYYRPWKLGFFLERKPR